MRRIKLGLLSILSGLSLLWWLADPINLGDGGYFAIRSLAVHYSGVLTMGVMSVAMLLALRPVWLEPLLGGLDKGYRLHKWLGIGGLALATVHWLWAQGTKWAVGWGWLARPQRGPRPEQTVEIFRIFQEQRGLAETIGEWAFYGFIVLAGAALIKRLPYFRFFQTHRLMAAVYLVLVAHSVVLLPFDYWSSTLGAVFAMLVAGGTFAAVLSLTGRIGRAQRANGQVARIAHHPGNQVLEVELQLRTPWAGHQAGQFAFVTFDPHEGRHPFTIASAWNGDGRMTFMIKSLGDYTRTLPDRLKLGDAVEIEGPYGRFDFGQARERQIWVAGGIGITPFMARLQALAREPAHAPVDLFYSTRQPDEGFIFRLRQLAEKARVRLHVLVTDRDGLLDADRIGRTVPEWSKADLWFCGPAGFGSALRRSLSTRGFNTDHFHQELFDMR